MRHAILIIAHKNAEQVAKLIKSLDDSDLDIYIHLDKKWKITLKELEMIKNASRNVSIIKKRISGFLDTWSLCEITIELIREALKKEQDYKYFILLSGQDYPIKTIEYIKWYLGKEYPKPIIDCTPLAKDNWIYSGFKWIRIHPYYRMVEKITASRIIRKLLLLPVYAIQVLITFFLKSPYSRLKKAGCDLYGGSAWWILPKEIVSDCVNEVEKNTSIIKAFRLKNTPEETFFQTMAMRSSFRDQVDLNDIYEIKQNCMTYAYFFDEEHEATGHPYVLTEKNFDMLRHRNELFARKFDLNIDRTIFELLDEKILRKGK